MDGITDFQQFSTYLNSGDYITVGERGRLRVHTGLDRLIRRIFCSESYRIQKIENLCLQKVRALQQSPVNAQVIGSVQVLYDSMQNRSCKLQMQREIIGLKYRNGQLEKDETCESFQELIELATEWKARQKCFKQTERTLNEHDMKLLKGLAEYAECADLVLRNRSLQIKFFKWSLRDGNTAELFAEFPALQDKISASMLSRRVGLHGQKVLRVTPDKDVRLSYLRNRTEKVDVSLLNEENTLNFTDNYSVTVKKVYEIFALKRKDILGNLEMAEKGVVNFHVQESRWVLGSGESEEIDFTKERWWEDLPTYKTLSIEEAKELYGQQMDGINWLTLAMGSSDSDTYTVAGSHGFMQVIIPVNGEYRIYPIGKFVVNFPRSSIARMFFIFRTVAGQMHALDQNVYCGHRQLWSYPIDLTPQQGAQLMKNIAEDFINPPPFSMRLRNCSEWVYARIKEVKDSIPDLYRVRLIDLEAGNPAKYIFKLLAWIYGGDTHHPRKLAERIMNEDIGF